jgi:hypothetical protein
MRGIAKGVWQGEKLRIAVTLDRELFKQIAQEAAKNYRSFNAQIKIYIDKGMQNDMGSTDHGSRQRAGDAPGQGHLQDTRAVHGGSQSGRELSAVQAVQRQGDL